MRLWTLHPKYLDVKGLTALWREALLARAVLTGRTKGYTNHPQLIRFRQTGHPVNAIEAYLRHVHAESLRRGYHFDATKLTSSDIPAPLEETQGQLLFEWRHLRNKLLRRAPEIFLKMQDIDQPEPHPLFQIIPGPVQHWEKQ